MIGFLAVLAQSITDIESILDTVKDPVGWVIVVYLVRWLTTRWEKQMESVVAEIKPLVAALVRMETLQASHAQNMETAMSLHAQYMKDAIKAVENDLESRSRAAPR